MTSIIRKSENAQFASILIIRRNAQNQNQISIITKKCHNVYLSYKLKHVKR